MEVLITTLTKILLAMIHKLLERVLLHIFINKGDSAGETKVLLAMIPKLVNSFAVFHL